MGELIRRDHHLREELGFPDSSDVTAERIASDILNWQRRKSAICYGVFLNSRITGMISLSHYNAKSKTARAGYWIETEFRRKGVATKAFERVVKIAQERGITLLSAKIDKTNYASIAIWEKYEAKKTEISSNQYLVSINI